MLPGQKTLNVLFILWKNLAAMLLWQDGWNVPRRIWSYLIKQFTFGKITVSAATLVEGVLVLVLALFLSRFLSSLLDRRIAKRANIDPGLRYTIVRLAKYFLTTVGILLFLQIAFDINLTSLAVIFTALSVGIGFGLQYIAADIASGFILLFERPIRVNDRITIGDDEGDVQSIKLRTTIVNTNDRIAIIVPNSRLVTQRVVNWSYGDPRARISIPIGVDPDSDVDLVTETLLVAAQGVDKVLSDPPPKVQFLKFGDYSLDFRLLVWTSEPRHHPQIRSDINYRLAKLFRGRGIKTARPVQELRIEPGQQNPKEPPLTDQRDSLPRADS